MKVQNKLAQSSAHAVTREDEIRVVKEMVSAARDSAAKMDLNFSAYLLDMAVVSLQQKLSEDEHEESENA